MSECHAWSPLSCCYRNVSEALHNDYSPLYGFTLDHCYREKRVKMSQECRDYFLRDHCFYECEPNLGPWVVPDPKKKWRKERIHSVPLCASECNDWFNACRNDFTCTDNWSTKFKWRRGTNHCPGICETFDHIFNGSAKTFCETVFDGDFVFTPDSSPCMRFRFDPDLPNPNAAVAEWKVHELKAAKATLVVENGIVKSGGDQRHVYSTGNSAEMSVASRPLALLLLLVCYVASN
ncbi:unnamed protein product [Cyprideis torosa]|uniref:Uncharacterized protein n=1 Tax=Cyprideis torosa TaxID=163714 RepID=A0A7R8W6Y9_9CRUS|nr:unnamed protein product [Cyprideis torosa]CAG0886986.1 unnamed protein product [Cyprideis torosa]